MSLQKSKVQLAQPTKNIYGILDGRANSEIGYISTGFLLNLIETIKILQLEKLANQSIFNGTFMIEIVNNSFYESKTNFLLIKRGTSNQK